MLPLSCKRSGTGPTSGTSVWFTVADGKVAITGKRNGTNAANVTQADLVANNAVVHVIDRVLLFQ